MPIRRKTDHLTLAAGLVAKRRASRLSQRSVAAIAGVTQASLSRIERGISDPSLSTVLETAHALGLELRLVPRELVPAVDLLLRSPKGGTAEPQDEGPLYAPEREDELS